MSKHSQNDCAATEDPFHWVSEEEFLSREEICELYQSRYTVFLSFDCIALPQFYCSFGNREPIPKEVAHSFYGANQEVTLLHRTTGEIVIVDGCRCYHVWKGSVSRKELSDVALMNVIMEDRRLTDIQYLQLAAYCNIQARDTQLTAFFERVYVIFAFYSAIMETKESGETSNRNEMTKATAVEKVGRALYLTTMFDKQFPSPVRKRNIGYVENLLRMNVTGCLEFMTETDLMDAVTYYCREAPSASKIYFDRQFFQDYNSDWFRSSPLLKQILLIFVLPSFPFWSECHEDERLPTTSSVIDIRALIRIRIPHLCEQISCFLSSYLFEELDDTNGRIRDHLFGLDSSEGTENVELDFFLIHNIAYDLQRAILSAESSFISGQADMDDRSLDNHVIATVKKSIMQYSVNIANEKVHLLIK